MSQNPYELKKLLICEGLGWPVVPGWIQVNPTDHRPNWRWYQEAHHIVLTDFGRYGLFQRSGFFPKIMYSFHDVAQVWLLENGFVKTHGENYSIILKIIETKRLNQLLKDKDDFILSATGEGIGHIDYATGYGWEPSDPLRRIRQNLKSINIEGRLNQQGLDINASGEIDDFEPALIAEHRRERNSQLLPCKDYRFHMTLPWALLIAEKFSFAARASRFIEKPD